LYFNVPLGKLPLAAVWSVLAGVAFFLIFLTIQLFATNQRAGAVLVNCLVFPLMFLGGSFFPFEAMPDWMAAVGRKTPNGWALEWLNVILFGSPEPPSLLAALAILCIVSAIFFVIGQRLLRRFARS
ncbi:MAG: ABC transporter permease, partial [Candidatus Saccharimonadales bacterium]